MLEARVLDRTGVLVVWVPDSRRCDQRTAITSLYLVTVMLTFFVYRV